MEKLWGQHPVGPETKGVRVVSAVGKRWFHVAARYARYTMVAGVPARVVREFGPENVASAPGPS